MKLNYNKTFMGLSNSLSGLLHSTRHVIHHKKKAVLAASFFMLAAVPTFAQETYCIPETPYADGQGITNVSIGIINNTTGLEAEGNYGDFTAQVVNIGQGTTYPLSISLATVVEYNVKVWIDWNNNFAFENNEQVFTAMSAEAPASTVTGTVTVPENAALGNHRMRVAARVGYAGLAQPCYSGFDAAAYEDYTVNVTPPPTCYIPGTPVIANTGNGTISVNWAAPSAGTPVGYEYATATTFTPPAAGTPVTGRSLTNVTVPGNVTGYIFVRTDCGNGNYSEWVSGIFYNGVCIPVPELSIGTGITNVTIGTINNETETEEGYYGDFSNLSVNIGQGVTQPFSITLTASSPHKVAVWVDWNNDLDFNDEGEKVFDATSSDRPLNVFRSVFTVPATAALGAHRIRVGAALTFGAEIDPCTESLGSYEDYTLNVTSPPTCFTPLSPVGITVSAGVANISWTAPTTGTAPTGYEYAVTTTTTPPATGTATTTTSVNGVTVTPHSVNYIHVRTNCGGGDYSEWMTAIYYNGYCIPAPQYRDAEGITNVTLGTINNTTGGEEGNYGDFSAQVANIGQGVNKPFSIGFNTDGPAYATKIWVDWNNDLDFDDEGEEVYTGISATAVSTVLRGYLRVPLTASLGNHRVRIGGMPENNGNPTPCSEENYGAYEDYTINVIAPPGCYTPDDFAAVSERAGFAMLTWTAPTLGGTPAGYEYAVTPTMTAPASGTATTATTLTGIAVTPEEVNYLHVRTNCGGGSFSEWITIELYNGICIPAPEYVDNNGITNVTIGNINNTTADEDTYNDFTAQVATIGQGVTQQFSLSLFTNNPYNIKMWVDFNDNLVFEESEEIYSGVSAAGSTATILDTFTIPVTAPLGNHRLRIAAVSNYVGDATPCGVRYGAAYEDYTINVTTPPSCFTPTRPVAEVIGSGNANLSWTPPTLGGTPSGYEYAVTTTMTPPASGTPVTGPAVTGYELEEDNTYYYLHVRTNCGDGDYSAWVISQRFRYLQGETCSTAVDLTTLTSPYSFTTEGAANDYSPSCGFGDAADIFYSIEVPNGYSLNIGLTSTNYDFISSLFYGGCTTANQTTVLCIDTFGEERSTTWENSTGQTQTLYWAQDGYESYFGNFTLVWSLTPPPTCNRPLQLNAVLTSLTSATVSWAVPNTGTPAGYEYAVTTSETAPENGEITTGLSIANVSLTPDTTNYLHVRSVCGEDGNSVWTTYAFYGGYCAPETTESTDFYISGITTAGGEININNTGTGYSAYTDYSAQHSVSTYPGGLFTIRATHPGDECLYSVWIDWNNDFNFDESERIISTGYLASPATIVTIAVPAATAQGSYRIRIRNTRAGSIPACGNTNSGEAEDYTLIIGAAPTCFPPYGLTITPVSETSAELSWSPPVAGLPQGYEYVLGTSPVAPTGSGTPTTDIYIYDVPFNPAQNAYLFVRSVCGGGDFSAWETMALLDTNVPQLTQNSILVYKEGSTINIASGNTLMTGINIYDIRGSKIYSQNNINAAQAAVTGLQIQQQVIILEITTSKGKVSKRIVF